MPDRRSGTPPPSRSGRRSGATPDDGAPPEDPAALQDAVLAWYGAHRRELPWRAPGVSGWAVLVSEVMLQQTPVQRVLPRWAEWLTRWPTPADLAAAPAGEAVRAWGGLGYPRRALRLHAAAVICRDRYANEVPAGLDELRALPGVGEYTAAAVAAFAHGGRALVLDTNVRRVLTRVLTGVAHPPAALSVAERARAAAVLPDDPARAARWSVGVMELGALVCTARVPRCDECPVRDWCVWEATGRPAAPADAARRSQAWHGTDRQARGRLLGRLRTADGVVGETELLDVWGPAEQSRRALAGLRADGLVEWVPPGGDATGGAGGAAEAGGYALPGTVSFTCTRQVARVAKGSGL